MSEPLVFLNGGLIPHHQAGVPLHDAGFVMGATVTDLCRTVRHRLYRWENHLERFRRSCAGARIPVQRSDEDLARAATELVEHNVRFLGTGDDLALVVFATPGSIGYYAGMDGGVGDAAPTLGMHTFPLPFARYRKLFREGARLAIPKTRQVPASVIAPQIKQRSRLHWWLADREVQELHPGASAVLLDESSHLTEAAAANVLIVKDGAVLTPPRETVLNGMSLLAVEELCRELSIAFVERTLAVSDAEHADEIMLSSTTYCLCGVSRFNDRPIPWPGRTFERLLAAWSQRIGLDIRGQIMADT